jgi:bifunctional non-homologous end joining protein LigD
VALEEYRRKRDFAKTPEPAGDNAGEAAEGGEGPADVEPGGAGPGGAGPGGAEPSRARARPNGPGGRDGAGAGPLYVVQKHDARRLHYDFRLELDGVLLSWALPKGPSLDPRDRRLAARTEDHPLQYGGFEGTIPEGEYGAGTVLLWDRGTWEPDGDPHEMLRKGDLKFTLRGEKLTGSWVLVRMKPRPGGGDKEEWLLIKHRDEAALVGDGQRILAERPDSVASGRSLEQVAASADASVWHGDRPPDAQLDARPGEEFALDPSDVKGAVRVAAPPRFVEPELATLVKAAPPGQEWLHEIKFDGYRTISRIERGAVRMYSRNGKDWTDRYRVIADDLARLPVESAVLDGEVVVVLPDGRSSFQELQRVLGDEVGHATGDHAGGGSGDDAGLRYYLFDLLYLDGYDLTGAAIEDRKDLLLRLLTRAGRDGRLLLSDHIAGSGAAVLEQACRMDLEGIVSKRAGGPYRPGTRTNEWVKAKCTSRQEFVIGGYTDPAGSRTGFGALLLGVPAEGGLRYVGKVGTGFDERTLAGLASQLRALSTDVPPFTQGLARAQKNAHWVRPELVAEVEFAEWTRDGGIRHPSFAGLREDKSAREVVAEVPAEAGRAEVDTDTGAGSRGPATPSDSPGPIRPPGAGGHVPAVVNSVTITHPDRVFWPTSGVTKSDLVGYYDMVAERMLPYVLDRPIAMLRCPAGVEDTGAEVRQAEGEPPPGGASRRRSRGGPPGCFFHKHPAEDFPGPVGRVMITESAGPAPYLMITGPGSLTALAQMGVLEIHVWGSTWPDIERPDMLVLDLDPGPGVGWPALADGARLVRDVLRSVRLESFVKTTGGKGLHVVAPVTPNVDWAETSRFCRRVAELMAEISPERFTANMSKAERTGKIYVDYVRNNRGSTSIAPFSTRAREQATVAVPLRWSELTGRIRPDTYTVGDVAGRLRRLKSDPWEDYFPTRDAQRLEPGLAATLAIA